MELSTPLSPFTAAFKSLTVVANEAVLAEEASVQAAANLEMPSEINCDKV